MTRCRTYRRGCSAHPPDRPPPRRPRRTHRGRIDRRRAAAPVATDAARCSRPSLRTGAAVAAVVPADPGRVAVRRALAEPGRAPGHHRGAAGPDPRRQRRATGGQPRRPHGRGRPPGPPRRQRRPSQRGRRACAGGPRPVARHLGGGHLRPARECPLLAVQPGPGHGGRAVRGAVLHPGAPRVLPGHRRDRPARADLPTGAARRAPAGVHQRDLAGPAPGPRLRRLPPGREGGTGRPRAELRVRPAGDRGHEPPRRQRTRHRARGAEHDPADAG